MISDSSEDNNRLNLKPAVNHEPVITEERENLETIKIENPEAVEDAQSTSALIKEEGRSEDGISRSSSLRFEDEDEKEVRNEDGLQRSLSLRFEDEDEDEKEGRNEDKLSRSSSLRFEDEDEREERNEEKLSRSVSLRFEDEDEKEGRNDDELSRLSSLRFENEDEREERNDDGLSRSVSLRFKDEDGTKSRVEDGLPRSVSLRFKDEDVKSGEDAHRLHRTVSWGVVSSVDEDFLHDESDLQIFSISKPEIHNVSSTKIEFKNLLNLIFTQCRLCLFVCLFDLNNVKMGEPIWVKFCLYDLSHDQAQERFILYN